MTVEPKNEASAGDLLAMIQQAGGTPELARLLAATLQAGPDGGLPGYEQGQLAVRKLGSLKDPAAVEMLIECFDAIPGGTALALLAARRDDPRVMSKLEAIAADSSNPALAERASALLAEPPSTSTAPPSGPIGPNELPLPPPLAR